MLATRRDLSPATARPVLMDNPVGAHVGEWNHEIFELWAAVTKFLGLLYRHSEALTGVSSVDPPFRCCSVHADLPARARAGQNSRFQRVFCRPL